jgi:hypothetical protein
LEKNPPEFFDLVHDGDKFTAGIESSATAGFLITATLFAGAFVSAGKDRLQKKDA